MQCASAHQSTPSSSSTMPRTCFYKPNIKPIKRNCWIIPDLFKYVYFLLYIFSNLFNTYLCKKNYAKMKNLGLKGSRDSHQCHFIKNVFYFNKFSNCCKLEPPLDFRCTCNTKNRKIIDRMKVFVEY